MCPCLTCSIPKSGPPCPWSHGGLTHSHTSSHQFLQSHHFHPTQENFFFHFIFPFSHSYPPCKVLQLKFTPGLLCANNSPFHTPPPAHIHQVIIHATPELKGCRHLLTLLVTVFLHLSGLTFHPGNKNVTLPSNKFTIINFQSWAQNNGEF